MASNQFQKIPGNILYTGDVIFKGKVTGVESSPQVDPNWENIGGDQNSVNLSGFNNDIPVIKSVQTGVSGTALKLTTANDENIKGLLFQYEVGSHDIGLVFLNEAGTRTTILNSRGVSVTEETQFRIYSTAGKGEIKLSDSGINLSGQGQKITLSGGGGGIDILPGMGVTIMGEVLMNNRAGFTFANGSDQTGGVTLRSTSANTLTIHAVTPTPVTLQNPNGITLKTGSGGELITSPTQARVFHPDTVSIQAGGNGSISLGDLKTTITSYNKDMEIGSMSKVTITGGSGGQVIIDNDNGINITHNQGVNISGGNSNDLTLARGGSGKLILDGSADIWPDEQGIFLKSNKFVKYVDESTKYDYTLPNKAGTLAMTSDIPASLTLEDFIDLLENADPLEIDAIKTLLGIV